MGLGVWGSGFRGWGFVNNLVHAVYKIKPLARIQNRVGLKTAGRVIALVNTRLSRLGPEKADIVNLIPEPYTKPNPLKPKNGP